MNKKCASEFLPQPKRIESMKKIIRLVPKNGHEWGVVASVLNRDMIKPDGTLDDLHAMIFLLGSFDTKEKAETHAKCVIEETGHPDIRVAKYGVAIPLTIKDDFSTISLVSIDTTGKIRDLETAQYKKDKECYEKRLKLERDLIQESEEEFDPENIEYFKRQCYLAIKYKAQYESQMKELEIINNNYKKREKLLREHYEKYPEHEKEWLPYLKEKLTERGELPLYDAIETEYEKHRDELLGL